MPVIVLTGAGFTPFVLLGLAAAFPNVTNIILNIIGLTFWGIVGLFAITCIVWIVGAVLWLFPSKTPKPISKS